MADIILPLSKGFAAVVDEIDAWVADHKWSATIRKRRIYAVRRKDGKIVYLHREILPDAPMVDHRDGDGLNCRRRNLRTADSKINAWNVGHFDAASGHMGVVKTRTGAWRAYISEGGRQKNIGTFDDVMDAAVARAHEEARIFGVQPQREAYLLPLLALPVPVKRVHPWRLAAEAAE